MSIGLAEQSPQKTEVRTIVADGLMTISEAIKFLFQRPRVFLDT